MASNHSQRAYRHIRKKLLDGSVAPGSRLSYGTIGKEIGISATPVREAVGQLASEGFVELVPQLGAVVRELSREEAVELYELREALESYAAAHASERISSRQLDELKANLSQSEKLVEKVRSSGKARADKSTAKKFHGLDLAFHMTVIEASRNRRMLKVVGDSHILTRIFQADRHEFTLPILEATQEEHTEIARAIESGNRQATHEAMRRHIRNSLNLTLTEADSDQEDRWWTE
jgi:DNA-binding GntR family transcriptional regulator